MHYMIIEMAKRCVYWEIEGDKHQVVFIDLLQPVVRNAFIKFSKDSLMLYAEKPLWDKFLTHLKDRVEHNKIIG